MSEWQPIETAPENVDYLLGWDGETIDVMERYVCGDGSRFWAIANSVYWDDIGAGVFRLEPTHWMPLPDPPKDS